jgi:protein involved in polysaccharide export with SLBB domain
MRVSAGFCTALLLGLPISTAAQYGSAPVSLRAGDQVMLMIKNEPGWSGRFTITPDGALMLPVIGLVTAVDRPFADVEASIRTGYARELAEPDVLITPLYRVSVMGEVRAPAFQWVDPTATVTDLLVMSGGLLPTASRNKIRLVRAGEEMRIRLDTGDSSPTLQLRSGDQLLVGRRSWISENLPIFIGAAASVAAAAVTTLIVK